MEERQSNFELMRIVSMFLIVLYHVIHHGNVISFATNNLSKILLDILQLVILVHVNSFLLLTGYFQCKSKFKMSKILHLFLLMIFYLFLFTIILLSTSNVNLDFLGIISFILLNFYSYWFLVYYILLYIFSSFINKLLSILSNKGRLILLFILLMLFSVLPSFFNINLLSNKVCICMHFVTMYILGACIRNISEQYKIVYKKYRISLVLVYIICILINYLLLQKGFYLSSDLDYNIFSIVVQSVCYFLLFASLDIKSKKINELSKFMIGIYLAHDCIYVRERLYLLFKLDGNISFKFIYVFYVIVIAIIIYIGAFCIEFIRYKLFALFINKKKKKLA